MQVIIPNDISIVSHNLGNSSQQKNNGTFPLDPSIYDKSKSPFYQIGDSVVSGDKIFRQIINPNAIPNANAIEGQPRFETLRDLTIRTHGIFETNDAGVKNYLGETCVISGNAINATLTCEGDTPNTGVGVFSGTLSITGKDRDLFSGKLQFYNNDGDIKEIEATRISALGGASVEWRIDNVIWDFADGAGRFNYTTDSFLEGYNNQSTLTPSFTGTLRFGYIEEALEPLRDNSRLDSQWLFINDIAWWVEIRAVNGESFIDKRPKIKTGRYGAVQVQVSSETPFDSVALVNCECLEAEVDYFAGEEFSCQVQGADTTPNNSNAFFSLSLTCIGNAPSVGTGEVDGVITLRSDTNFTWNGVASNSFGENPQNLVATRMPNDGANNAPIQRWIVKGAVFDFTRAGGITIINAIGETNFTGSFEGVVSYEGNTTITLSPDAPHEPSDLLFTDLQPIANDAGIYTATINIKADDATIPTATNTTKRPFASLGQIVLGKHATIWEENTTKPEIGDTDIDSFSKTFIDFSKVERNEYGDITTTPRESTWGIDATAKFPRHKAKAIERIISNLGGAKPAVFYQSNMITDGTLLYGYIANAGITFRQGDNKYQQCKISIEGLV